MFRTVPLSIIRSFSLYTQQWYLCWESTSRIRTDTAWSCSQAVSKPVWHIQGDSVARGPKLLSIKNYVIEIMTWKFIHTYRERCKTGPAHNRRWNWSPFTSKDTWMRFSKFWNTFPNLFAASSERITLYMSYRFADSLWAGSGLSSVLILLASCQQNCMTYTIAVWHTPLLCAQWKTPDDGQRNCPKHVEFYYKNKLEKIVHLVGFIIRIAKTCFKPISLKEGRF